MMMNDMISFSFLKNTTRLVKNDTIMMMKMIAMMIIRMNRKLEDVVGTHRMLLSCWGEEFEDALYISGCVTI